MQLLDVVPTQGEVNYKLVITTKNKTVRLTRKVFLTSEDSKTGNNVENNLGNVDPGEVTFDSACPAGLADQLIAQINQVRIRHGLSALSYSSRLALAADWHARANAAVKVLSHDGWFQRINDSGFLYSSISQNIASAYTGTTIEVLVDLWMNSQGHKANILDPGMTVTGVSCATADNGIVYWAQNFGAPR